MSSVPDDAFPFTQSTSCFLRRHLTFFDFDVGDFEEGAPEDKTAKEIWYERGRLYWQTIPTTVEGMVLGPGASAVETRTIERELEDTISLLKENDCEGDCALDCGAGIGRVSQALGSLYSSVDMLEPCSHLLDFVKKKGGAPGNGRLLPYPIQGYNPTNSPTGPYDLISINWCASFVTDDDLILFLNNCRPALTNSGKIFIKENITETHFRARRGSASVARTDSHYLDIFKAGNLSVIAEKLQEGLPDGWLPVKMYLLVPLDRSNVLNMSPTPVWLDCDPGHDDAMAIILSMHSPDLKLLGVSTVSGNQSIEKVTKNAAKMVTLCSGESKPPSVVRGAERPLLRTIKHDPGIHGESGLEGSVDLDDFRENQSVVLADTAITFMAQSILKSPDKVSLIATGALTNVALLCRVHPEVLKNINQIVLMGGAIGVGNRHPVAEFNIECDPEAAHIVFNLPVKVVMVPLEVTHTALCTPTVINEISRRLNHTVFSRIVVSLMLYFAKTYKDVFGFHDGPPVHDPCAVAYVINPNLFETRLLRVDVVTGNHITAGQTVCDIWGSQPGKKNVIVAEKMNVNGFWELIIKACEAANVVSVLGLSSKARL